MLRNLLKFTGYALVAREVADLVTNSQHLREKRQSRKETVCLISGSVIGMAVGVGLGILFAPRAGKETREIIVDAACEQIDRFQMGVSEGRKRMGEILSGESEEPQYVKPESVTPESAEQPAI